MFNLHEFQLHAEVSPIVILATARSYMRRKLKLSITGGTGKFSFSILGK